MNRSKPVVLFTTPVLQYPPVGGPTLRIENSIKALSQISELYICSRVSLDSLGGTGSLSFYQQYCKFFYFTPSVVSSNKNVEFVRRIINFLSRKVIHRSILQSGAKSPKKDFEYLLKVANVIRADVIWMGFGNISYPMLNYIKQHSSYKVVVDTDSVWSRFIMRGLPFAETMEERKKIQDDGKNKQIEEAWGTKMADVTTAVSEVDAEYYRGLTNDPGKVHLFSNVIDMEMYKQVPPPPGNFRKPCIYLAGTFWSKSPMEDAARWVISQILTLVQERIPVHLYIVGKGSDQVLADINHPSVTITGQLPSVLPYLCHADVALVPLRFESGTRFKILEAGACGIPVVSTTLGAEGLPVTHEKEILIADTPEQFAASIIRVIKDRAFAVGMAQNLKKLVEEQNSISTLAHEGFAVLNYLDAINSKDKHTN